MTRNDPKVRQELERIRKAGGGILRAEDVVKRAADASSPLHDLFEWDDTAAAHQWRLDQARNLIRVTVTVMPPDDTVVQCYVSLKRDRVKAGGGYRAVAQVLSDDQLRAEMLTEAMDEMKSFKQRYDKLAELRPIFDATEQVQREQRQPRSARRRNTG